MQRLHTYLAKLILAVVVPLLVLAGLLIYVLVQNERGIRLRAMQDLASTLSAAVDAEVERTLLALQFLATSDAVDRQDLEALRAQFDQVRDLHGLWSGLGISAGDGTPLMHLGVPSGQPLADSAAWRLGLDDPEQADRPFVSDVTLDWMSGRPTVLYGVPVFREGTRAYRILASMEYGVWSEWLRHRIPDGMIAAIDDRNGIIFARSERPEAFVGRPAVDALRVAYARSPEGIVRTTNRDGVDVFLAYVTSDKVGWHTLIVLPASVVNETAVQYGLTFAGATGLLLVVTLLVALRMAQPLSGGIDRLRASIRLVGTGQSPEVVRASIIELNEAQEATTQAAEQLAAARDALMRQREELRTMLDLLPVGVAVAHDAMAERVTLSPVFERMLAVPPIDGCGGVGRHTAYRLLQGGKEMASEDHPLRRAARDGEDIRGVECDVVRPDGQVLHLWVNAAPLFDASGQVRGAIAAHIDVTSLKSAQRALQDADRQKNEFLATLAHELRNPMAPIRYAAATLSASADPALIRHAQRVIERQSAHMARLLDDLLDLSRISRNVIALKREVIDLLAVVAAAVENARPVMDEHRHTIETDVSAGTLWVSGDAVRLVQVMDNLLTNACKYTPPGGRITVAAAAAHGYAEVRVTDTGVGLTPEMVPKIFELFAQANRSPGRGSDGLGIGLTVVSRLVELHGGTIEVQSAGLDAGSTFIVRLPLVVPPARTPAVEPVGALSLADRPLEILVVDDNVDAANSLARILELAGHRVQTAQSAEAALALVVGWQPDVAVLDIGLPGASGNELARELRARQWGSELLLVAVTGWGDESERVKTTEAGFDAHLVKPIDPNAVLSAVARFGERRAPGPI
jgi:signal transduction histidine kinase/ActR/RegA family two-component response regulator